jgi:hypothetical protein
MTTAMDPTVMVAVFAGAPAGSSGLDRGPFITPHRIAFAAGGVASVGGALISAMRGGHRSWEEGDELAPNASDPSQPNASDPSRPSALPDHVGGTATANQEP